MLLLLLLFLILGKTVIITGATSGIGKETARDLAWRKARIILACRNIKKGLETAVEIIESSGNKNVEVKKLDLASFQSIHEFAEEINEEVERVDILINNAGCGGLVSKTKDNLDSVFQVNYLSHFLLTNLLLDKLKASSPSRVINVSSIQHANGNINFDDLCSEKNYKGWLKAYSNTKLAQMLFTMELSKKLEGVYVFNVISKLVLICKIKLQNLMCIHKDSIIIIIIILLNGT